MTHCFSSLVVQKDQNKAVGELLVENSLKQEDTVLDTNPWTVFRCGGTPMEEEPQISPKHS